MKNQGYIYMALGLCVLIITILPPVFYMDIATLLLGFLLIGIGKDEVKKEKDSYIKETYEEE